MHMSKDAAALEISDVKVTVEDFKQKHSRKQYDNNYGPVAAGAVP